MTPDELYDLLLRHPKACQSCDIALAESGGFRFWSIGNRPSRRSDDPYFKDAVLGALVNEAERRGWSIDRLRPKDGIAKPVSIRGEWRDERDGMFRLSLGNGPTIIAALLAALEDA